MGENQPTHKNYSHVELNISWTTSKVHCLIGREIRRTRIERLVVICLCWRDRATNPAKYLCGFIEILSPGTRKIELYDRPYNIQPLANRYNNSRKGILNGIVVTLCSMIVYQLGGLTGLRQFSAWFYTQLSYRLSEK